MNEQTIQMIAQAIIANTKVLQSLVDSLPQEAAQQVAKAADVAPSAPVAQPVATPEPAPAPVATPEPAPAMPAPPTFAEAPAPAAAAAPFTDSKGLIDYVMGVYKIIGPAKGAGIQNVLTSLGYQNINDIKPEHYGALYAGVEALKG